LLSYAFSLRIPWEHLHQFLIRGKPYGVWKPGGISFCDNPHQVRLRDFHFRCKERWVYEYDLADRWQHEIRLEQILPLDPAKSYPICLAGKRRTPLEDCGGPWAFMALRDAHPLWEVTAQFAQLLLEHRDELEDYREELGRLGYWIVCEDFDRQAVNRRLAAYAAMCTREKERRL
jgi:hypothetical protein